MSITNGIRWHFPTRDGKDGKFSAGGAKGGRGGSALEAEALETLVEFRKLAAAVDEPVNARPGGMGLGIDVELERVSGLAVSGARIKARAIGHNDRDLVIFRVDVFFHAINSA